MLDSAYNNGFGTLVPIKLDIEAEGKKLKENFLWDRNEPYLTYESFAKILIEEHNLPAPLFEQEIINSMKKQINTVFRSNTAPYKPLQDGEAIRILKLNVRIGHIILRDQLEWDINNPRNSPEVRLFDYHVSLGLRGNPVRRPRAGERVPAADSSPDQRADS